MFSLAYEEHIEVQKIKSEYINEYKAANRFIKKYKVYLPYYYVAVWDIWKIHNCCNSVDIEYNRIRQKNVIDVIPDFYKELLSGISFYPTKKDDRTNSIELGASKRVMTTIIEDPIVPFYCYLPTFDRHKNKIPKYKNGLGGRFFHPISMMEVPFTNIYAWGNLSKEVQTENMTKRPKDCGPKYYFYTRHIVEADVKPQKKISKMIYNLNDLTKQMKNELIARLDNNSPTTAELVLEFEKDKIKAEIFKRWGKFGFAVKTYYDIINQNKTIQAKDTLLGRAFASQLSLEETNELLSSSGYILSPALPRDVIIAYFIEKGINDLKFINNLLENLELKILKGKKR